MTDTPTTTRLNATMHLDRTDTRLSFDRTLYRVIASRAIPSLGIVEGAKGGWVSAEPIVGNSVLWIATDCTFVGGTFEGGTFVGGTFEGGTFWGGTFLGGTFRGGTFRGGTFRGGTFWGGDSIKTQPVFLAGLRWDVTITDKHIGIGCQHHRTSQWAKFSDAAIERMDGDALAFWQAHKAMILALAAVKRPAAAA